MSTLRSTPPPAAPRSGNGSQPTSPEAQAEGLSEGQKRALIAGAVLIGLLVAAGAIWAAVALVNNPTQAASVRDVFIIFMALETMVIGVALIVLIVQIAVLTNLLRHEIKPILDSTNETVNTVRGTTIFLSENLVEPVMKLNSYVAGLSRLVETLGTIGGLVRKK